MSKKHINIFKLYRNGEELELEYTKMSNDELITARTYNGYLAPMLAYDGVYCYKKHCFISQNLEELKRLAEDWINQEFEEKNKLLSLRYIGLKVNNNSLPHLEGQSTHYYYEEEIMMKKHVCACYNNAGEYYCNVCKSDLCSLHTPMEDGSIFVTEIPSECLDTAHCGKCGGKDIYELNFYYYG